MDIEQLKLILEAVKEVSADASSVAIWWIVGSYAVGLLIGLLPCIILLIMRIQYR